MPTEVHPQPGTVNFKIASKGNDFVGLSINGTERRVVFPMGYRSSWGEASVEISANGNMYREEILLLVKSICGCKKLEGKRSCKFNDSETNEDFPIASILFLIEDFFDRGTYYTEREKITKQGQSGKISWPRTIKQIKPIVSERGIAFLDFIVHAHCIKEDQLITELHKYAVHKSFELLGFLYTSALPEQGLITEKDVQKNLAYYVGFLEEKISQTHLEKNAELFLHIKYLLQNFNCNENLKTAEYGTRSFQTVWQSMIESIYSTISAKVKKNYFYPKSRWNFVENGNNSIVRTRNNAPLQPDTIMIDEAEKTCFILDAKYYSYGALSAKATGNDDSGTSEDDMADDEWDDSKSVSEHGSIPGTDSIQKQITYAEYIDNSRTPIGASEGSKAADYKFDSDKIFNAFLLPGNVPCESNGSSPQENMATAAMLQYIGYAEACGNTAAKESYRKIHGFLLDTKRTMELWGRSNDACQRELAKAIMEKTKI